MHCRSLFSAVVLVLVIFSSLAPGADWLRFRGPNGSGVAAEGTSPPVEWSPTQNVKWKLDIPGAGVSSPIVVDGRVFITCYSGYGVSRDNPGNIADLTRHLLCVDAENGEIKWQKSVPSTATEDPYQGPGVPQHGYASHTPVSDGEHVFAFFGKSGVFAYDLEGNQLWHREVGTESDPMRWGSSSSPIVHEDLLVVPAGPEARAIVGLDKRTGEERWRAEAEGLGMVWGTPAIAQSKAGDEIVIGAPYEIWALNPTTGKLNWFCEAVESDQFSSSVVISDNIVLAMEGRGGGSVAVSAGGEDDVSQSNIAWRSRETTRFASPVIYQGRVYSVNNGIVTCLDAKTGTEIFKGRLREPGQTDDSQLEATDAQENGLAPQRGGGRNGPPGGGRGGFGGGDYASPVIANGRLYYVRRSGETYVIAASDKLEQLAVNRVSAQAEEFSATPAIADGKIFIRSDRHLYCVANEAR